MTHFSYLAECLSITVLGVGALVSPVLADFNQGKEESVKAPQEISTYDASKQDHSVNAIKSTLEQEADNVFRVGLQHYHIGNFRSAINTWQQSLDLYDQSGNLLGESIVFTSLSLAYKALGDEVRAIELHDHALDKALEGGSVNGGEAAFNALGIAYYYLNDNEISAEILLEILENSNFSKDENLKKGLVLGTLGYIHNTLNKYETAIVFHLQALEVARQENTIGGEGIVLNNLGLAYLFQSEYEEAIQTQLEALGKAREVSNKDGEMRTLRQLGYSYDALGQYDTSIDYYGQALEISRRLGDKESQGIILSSMGESYYFLDDYQRAWARYNEALTISREIINRNQEAIILGGLGDLYKLKGDEDLAIQHYQESLELAIEINNPSARINALIGMAGAYLSLGKYQDAIGLYEEALTFNRALEIPEVSTEVTISFNLGLVAFLRREFEKSEHFFNLFSKAFESILDRNQSDKNQLSLIDSKINAYVLWQRTLLEQGQIKAALAISEQSRAQALKLQMLHTLSDEQFSDWGASITIETMQQIAADQNATLVNYTVSRSGKVLIWVIQPDKSITFHPGNYATSSEEIALLPTLSDGRGPKQPNTALQELVRGSSNYTEIEDLNLILEKLYNALIAPIDDVLPINEDDLVIFIPHQDLFQVPFAALRNPDTDEYLIQNHTISTAPSILSLALTEARQAEIEGKGTGALIVGNPTLADKLADIHNLAPLPGAEIEAQQIATLLNASPENILLREAATKAAVTERLHTAKYVHLATHGLLLDTPAYSTIPGLLALAPSTTDKLGEFTAQEIIELTQAQKLVADLVVLSACSTGQGQITSDGTYGLSRAFLTSGTPSLIVSLWDVSDRTTQLLMTEFYSHLIGTNEQDPLGKAQALRQAMLTIMEHDRGQYRKDPRYWAAFTLIGQPD